MTKYLVSVSYDGSYFRGWARQKNSFTVQSFIEDRISKIFSCKTSLLSSSRTDKGVHAIDQKFTFFLSSINIEGSRMQKILCKSLKNFVHVEKVSVVDEDFNLRKNVVLKEYRYLMILKNYSIFHRNYFFDADSSNFNLESFKESLKKFEGKHDFFNFSHVKENEKEKINTLREIKKIDFEKNDNSDLLYVKFFSKGFLRYQIRAIIGECIDKHSKENGIETLVKMLESNKTFKYKKIAPPSGLYLWKVSVKDDK